MIRIVELKERQHRLSENVQVSTYSNSFNKIADLQVIAKKLNTISNKNTLFFEIDGAVDKNSKRLDIHCGSSKVIISIIKDDADNKKEKYQITVVSYNTKFDNTLLNKIIDVINTCNRELDRTINLIWSKSGKDKSGKNSNAYPKINIGKDTYSNTYVLVHNTNSSKANSSNKSTVDKFVELLSNHLCSISSNTPIEGKFVWSHSVEGKVKTVKIKKNTYNKKTYTIKIDNTSIFRESKIIIHEYEPVTPNSDKIKLSKTAGLIELVNIPTAEYYKTNKKSIDRLGKKSGSDIDENRLYFYEMLKNIAEKVHCQIIEKNTYVEKYNRQYKCEQKRYPMNRFGKYYNSYIQDYVDIYIDNNTNKTYAKRNIDELLNAFENGMAYVDGNIARWHSNNSIPPKDIIEFWEFTGITEQYNIDVDECTETRDAETIAELDAYRKSRENYEMSDEEIYELQSAFGTGEEIVDVITGKKYYT